MTTAELHHREFTAGHLQIRQAEDGHHYAEGLAVPYMVPTEIIEFRDNGPISYREQFAPGAFARAVRAADRYPLVYGHSESFGDRLGSVVMGGFTETPAGLMMRARLDPSRAEQAIDALTTSHSALSVAFRTIVPRAGSELPGALITRRSVHLAHIAAVPLGAYADARLTSVRAGEDPEPTPAEIEAQEQAAQDRALLDWVDTLSDNPWAGLQR